MSSKNWIKKILVLCLLIASIAGAAMGCASTPAGSPELSAPINLKDGLGNTLMLNSPAQRVVSLAPGNTEMLFAVGAGGQVVGRDSFSDYPVEAKAITDIGGGFSDINSEIIVSLKPDLVLASMLTSAEQLKTLQDVGLKVFTVANPIDFPTLFENLRTVARLTGHTTQAEQLISQLEQRVKKVEQKTASLSMRPLVFYELDGTDPSAPWTAGPGSFVGMIIELAGGKNLGANLGSEWAQISTEQLIAQDPQIILLGDATLGGVTPADVQRRSGWGSLSAIQTGKVYIFDDNLVSRPGPRMVDGLEAMAKLLHPELFQ